MKGWLRRRTCAGCRRRGSDSRLGAESFFFQEGDAKYYAGAKYGDLRVAENGDSVLSGLRGKELEKLGPDAGMGK